MQWIGYFLVIVSAIVLILSTIDIKVKKWE
jgi:hypothetical protein